MEDKEYVSFLKYIVKLIIKSLKNLHSLNITHNNLTLNNIVVYENKNLMIMTIIN